MLSEACLRAGRHRGSRWALITLAYSGAALANDTLIPYASAQFEYNSNIFNRPDQAQATSPDSTTPGGTLLDDLLGTGQPTAQNGLNGEQAPSDRVLRYVAGIEVNLPLSNQKLRAVAEGRRFEFSDFSHLDHDEHLLSAGLDWSLTIALNGTLDYRQERRMASFADRNTTELTLEDERTGSGSLKLDFTPEWRLEAGLRSRELESPLPDFPQFALKENTIAAAIKYLIVETLAAGVFAEYLSGRFEGTADAQKFHQESLGLAADYTIDGLSRLGAQLGYTRRQDDGAATGMLTYHRELSAKTVTDVQVFRRVRSYVGGASSVTETGAGVALAWRPTEKISLSADYQRIEGQFEEETPSAGSQDRKDESQVASLSLTYQMLSWLSLRPYGGYQKRDSNIDRNSFKAEIAGVELRARFQ